MTFLGRLEPTPLGRRGRAGPAAIYPVALCRAILEGAEDQRIREGVLPPYLLSLLEAGRAVFELQRGPARPDVGPAMEIDSEILREDRLMDEDELSQLVYDMLCWREDSTELTAAATASGQQQPAARQQAKQLARVWWQFAVEPNTHFKQVC